MYFACGRCVNCGSQRANSVRVYFLKGGGINGYTFPLACLTAWWILLPLRCRVSVLPCKSGQELTLASSWQPARSQAFQFYNTRKWILPNTWMSSQAYYPPVESPDESTAQVTPSLTLVRPWAEDPDSAIPRLLIHRNCDINICCLSH